MKSNESTTPEAEIPSVRSEPLLGKLRTAWCHYNALASELEYSLSEGGDTDVTRDQVEHAWEDLNSLIMTNAPADLPAIDGKVQRDVGDCRSCEHNDDLITEADRRDGGACFLGLAVCTPPVKHCPSYQFANSLLDRNDLPNTEQAT